MHVGLLRRMSIKLGPGRSILTAVKTGGDVKPLAWSCLRPGIEPAIALTMGYIKVTLTSQTQVS